MYVKHFGVPAHYLNGECASNSQWLVYGRTKDGTVWRTESLDGAPAHRTLAGALAHLCWLWCIKGRWRTFDWCAGAPVDPFDIGLNSTWF
jgi:hypothetical protein